MRHDSSTFLLVRVAPVLTETHVIPITVTNTKRHLLHITNCLLLSISNCIKSLCITSSFSCLIHFAQAVQQPVVIRMITTLSNQACIRSKLLGDIVGSSIMTFKSSELVLENALFGTNHLISSLNDTLLRLC